MKVLCKLLIPSKLVNGQISLTEFKHHILLLTRHQKGLLQNSFWRHMNGPGSKLMILVNNGTIRSHFDGPSILSMEKDMKLHQFHNLCQDS